MADIFDLAKGKDTGKANSKPAQNTKQDIFSLASNIPKPEEKSYTMPAAEQPTAARPAAKGSLFSKWLAAIGEMGNNADPYAGYATDPLSYEQIYGSNKTTERAPAKGSLIDRWNTAIETNPRTSVSTGSQFMGGGQPIQFKEPELASKTGRTLDQVRAQNVEETWKPATKEPEQATDWPGIKPRDTVADRRAAMIDEGAKPVSFQQRMAMQGYEEKRGDLVGQATSGREAAIEAARPYNAAQETQPTSMFSTSEETAGMSLPEYIEAREKPMADLRARQTELETARNALQTEYNELNNRVMWGKIGVDYTAEDIENLVEMEKQLADYDEQIKALPKFVDWDGRAALIAELNEIDTNAGYITNPEEANAAEERRDEIIAELEAGDAAVGNPKMAYTGADRGRATVAGAIEQFMAGYLNFAGTALDLLAETPVALGGNVDPYAGYATDALSSELIGYTPASAGDYADVKKAATSVQAAADSLGADAAAELEKAKGGLGAIGQAGVDIAANILQMGFDAAVGALPGVGSLTSMFVRSAGSSAQEARYEGANVFQQAAYGAASGGIEVFTEKMAGIATKIYGPGIGDEVAEEVIRKLTKSDFGRSALRWLSGAASEGFEEVVSDLLAPYAETIYNGKTIGETFTGTFSGTYDAAEILYDFLIGAAVGGLSGGGTILTGGDAAANYKLRLADAGLGDVNSLANDAWDVLTGETTPEEQQAREAEARRALGLETEEQQEAPRPTREARPEIEEEGRAEAQESRPEPHREARPEIEEEGKAEPAQEAPVPRQTVEEQRAAIEEEGAQPAQQREAPAPKQTAEERRAETEEAVREGEIRREQTEEFAQDDSAQAQEAGELPTPEAVADEAADGNETRRKTIGKALDRSFDKSGIKLNAEEKNALADGYKPGKGTLRVSEYAAAAREAYRLGAEGQTLDEAKKGSRSGKKLSAEQFETAWQLGADKAAGTTTAKTTTESRSTTAQSVDVSTDDGREKLNAALASLGNNASTAAEAYEAGQDVNKYAAAMSKAVRLYAANGLDLKTIVQDARAGKSSDIVGQLTDAQIETAEHIGQSIREETQQRAEEVGRQLKTVRQKAASISAAVTATDAEISSVNAAIREANKAGKAALEQFNAQYDALEKMAQTDPDVQSSEEYAKAYDEAKQNGERVRKLQEQIEKLEARKKELESRKPGGRKKGGVTYAEKEGTVGGVKYSAVDKSKLTDTQKATARIAEVIARATGLDIRIVDFGKGVGGEYLHGSGGVVYLNINASFDGKNVSIGSLCHEITHWFKEYAPAEYEELKAVVLQEIGKDPEAFSGIFGERAAVQPNLTTEELTDEMVANACQTILMDEETVQRLVNEHRTLAEKIRDFILNIISDIKAAFSEIDVNSDFPLYKEVRAAEGAMEQMREIWLRAFDTASENMQAEQTVGANENTAPKGGEVQFQRITPENDSIRVQIQDVQDELNSMGVVAKVNVSNVPKSVSKAVPWAVERLKHTGFKVDRQGFGVITFDEGHIREALRHITNHPDEIGAILALPRVLKRGKIIEQHERHQGRTPDSFTIAAPVEVNGVRGNMAVVVQRTTKNYYHAHRVLMPDGSNFTFETGNKKAVSKRTGELPERALIAESVDTTDKSIAQPAEKSNSKMQVWDAVEDEAAKHFGTTDDFRTAGYILQDGQMLDFSGAHWLDGNDEKYIAEWRSKNDIRQVDHEDVYEAFEAIDEENAPNDAALTFIKRGNIRIVPESPGIELSADVEPSAEQYRQIKEFIRTAKADPKHYRSDSFSVDLTKDRRHKAGALRYDGNINPERIVNDIKHFYSTGEVRDQGLGAFLQRWDDTSNDTAAERAARDMAYERLQSENAILSETVKAVQKLADKQSKTIAALQKRLSLTKTPEVRESDARKLTKELLQEYGSRADRESVSSQIKALGDYILQTPTAEISEDELKNRARAIAAEIAENAVEDMNIDSEMYQQIAGDIRGTKLSIDEDFTGELDGGLDDFRKRMFGSFTLAKRESKTAEIREGYSSVDQFYTDMQNQYGKSFFPDVANEGEELQVLSQLLDAAKPMEVNPYEQYMGEATEEIANRIVMDAMSGVLRETAPTTADRNKARTDALRERIKGLQAENKMEQREAARLYQTVYDLSMQLDKAESRYETLRQEATYRTAQMRAEGAAKAAEIKAKERERAAKEIAALKEHYRDMQERARERRGNTATRKKIRKLIADLNQRLSHPTEFKHVPKELTRATIDLLEMIDDPRGYRTEKGALDAAARIADIRQVYDSYKTNPEFPGVYDEAISEMLDTLAQNVRGTALRDMNETQLQSVYRALQAMTHVVNDAVKVKIGNEERNAFQMAREMTKETREVPKAQKGWLREHGIPAHLRADVAFDRFGGFKKNSTWQQAARLLNDGQLKQTRLKMQLSKPFANLFNNQKALSEFTGMNALGKVDAKKLVDVGLKDENGNAIPITRDFMVALYMDLLNEDNRRHFIRGGKTVPNFQDFYDGKGGYGIGSKRAVGIAAQLIEAYHELEKAKAAGRAENGGRYVRSVFEGTEIGERVSEAEAKIADLESKSEKYANEVKAKIESLLTEYDRAWVEATKQLMDVDSKRELNKTTMEVYGIEKFSVPNYFPIFTDKDFVSTPMETITKDASIENAGFTKERVKSGNPTNAVGMVWAITTQIDRVAQYCGLMPAIRNFGKVYSKAETGYTDGLKKALNETFGKAGTDYVENLIADLQGARKAEHDELGLDKMLGGLRGNLARSTLTLNPRVALAQAASFPTAAAELGYKPIMKALAHGGKNGTVLSRADQELIAKWSPLLWYRMQGYATPELGDIQSSNRFADRVWRKARFVTGWIQAVDGATVGRLWYAAEYWVQEHKANLEKGSGAYYEAVAEKFNDVVEKTQPNYTTMQRAAILRNPNSLVKTFTMFMTQRLQNFNILYDAAGRYQKARADFANNRNGVTKEDVSEARNNVTRAVTSQIAAQAMFVGIKVAVDFLLHSIKRYRDDETGDITEESTSLAILDAFCDAMVGTVIFGSELYGIAKAATGHGKWYGLSLNGVDTVSDLIESMVNLTNGTYDLKDKKSRKTLYNRTMKLAANIAQALGYPLNNALKMGQAVYYHIVDAANGEFLSYEAGYDRTTAQNANKIILALENGDDAAVQAATEAFESEKEALSAVRAQVKKQYEAGDRTAEDAVSILEKAGMDSNDAWFSVNSWETGDGSKYTAAKRAAFIGDKGAFHDAMKDLTAHGVKEKDVYSEIKGFVKKAYFGSEIGEEEAKILGDKKLSDADARILLAKYCGLTADEATKQVEQWHKDRAFEAVYGFKYSQRKSLYLEGDVSRYDVRKALMSYDSMTGAEADLEIEAWEWSRDVPGAESISTEAVRKYKLYCAEVGVSKANYVAIWKFISSVEGDKDANGKTIAYSEAKKVLAEIGKLNISADRKNALALSFYAERTVKKYKTW